MLWHTSSAMRSVEAVDVWIELFSKSNRRSLGLSRTELFEQLQNILHQAGCVSRYFFPSREKPIHAGRARRLRQALDVKDGNPLAGRDLRNAIEHFDERLDKYLLENHVGTFFPEDVDYLPPESEVPLHVFKGFYVQPEIFVLLGTPYKMAPVVDEMLRIHGALQASVQNGYRLPFVEVE